MMQEMQEKWVRSLGWEDPVAKKMATQSSILAWESPWTDELGKLQSTGSQRVRHYLGTELSEGNQIQALRNLDSEEWGTV